MFPNPDDAPGVFAQRPIHLESYTGQDLAGIEPRMDADGIATKKRKGHKTERGFGRGMGKSTEEGTKVTKGCGDWKNRGWTRMHADGIAAKEDIGGAKTPRRACCQVNGHERAQRAQKGTFLF